MAAIVASNFAVAAPTKVAARKLSARKAVALPGESFSSEGKFFSFFYILTLPGTPTPIRPTSTGLCYLFPLSLVCG